MSLIRFICETLSRNREQTKQKQNQAQAIKQQFSEQRRIKSARGKIYKNLFCTIFMIASVYADRKSVV